MWFLSLILILSLSIDDVTPSSGHGLVMPQKSCRIRCENGGMCAFSFENPTIHSCICLMGVYSGERCEILIGEDPLKKENEVEMTEKTQQASADVIEEMRRREQEKIEQLRNAERRKEYERKIKEEEDRRRQMYSQQTSQRPQDNERAREIERRREEMRRRDEEMRKRGEEMKRREDERKRLEEERRQEYARREEERIEKQRQEEARQVAETQRKAEEERAREAERIRQEAMKREEEMKRVPTTMGDSEELTDEDMEPGQEYDEWDYSYSSSEDAGKGIDYTQEVDEEHEVTSDQDHHRHVTETGWNQETVSENTQEVTGETTQVENEETTQDENEESTVAEEEGENAFGPIGKILEEAAEKTIQEHGLNLESKEGPVTEEYDDYWDHHPETIDDFDKIPKIVDSEEEEGLRRDKANPHGDDAVREFDLKGSEDSDGWMMSSRADPQESSATTLSLLSTFIALLCML